MAPRAQNAMVMTLWHIRKPLDALASIYSLYNGRSKTTEGGRNNNNINMENIVAAAPPRPIFSLPDEIHMLIIGNLPFADIERLRRSCQFYRNLITPSLVWAIFSPNLRSTLLSHCYKCLRHDPDRTKLLCPDQLNPRYPLSSRCLDCASRDGYLVGGRKVVLANFTTAWVCHWCGYPAPWGDSSRVAPDFHSSCYSKFNTATNAFYLLGTIQAMVAIVTPALCWHLYARIPSIMGLSIAAFVVSLLSTAVSAFRVLSGGDRYLRTYHISVILEASLLAMWSGIIYTVIQQQVLLPENVGLRIERPNWYAVITFAAINM